MPQTQKKVSKYSNVGRNETTIASGKVVVGHIKLGLLLTTVQNFAPIGRRRLEQVSK